MRQVTEGLKHALQVLEFDAIRRALAEQCQTPMAAAASERLVPSFEPDVVWFEQDRTRQAHELLDGVSASLEGVTDLREPLRRASRGGVLEPTVLYRIAVSLRTLRVCRHEVEARREAFPDLWALATTFVSEPGLEARLFESVDGDGAVRDEASSELGTLRAKIARAQQRVVEKIQSFTSGKTRELLSDPIYTQRDGRLVIPLKAEYRGRIRGIVHDTSSSGQTLFVEPEQVVALGNLVREAQAAERAEVERILAELSSRVGEVGDRMIHAIGAAGELDAVLARARLGFAQGGCLPKQARGAYVRIAGGRHPLLERATVVPLSLEMGGDGPARVDTLLITGPNTGGKTVAIKAVGLCVAMAQSGLLPTADEMALGCFSGLFADIGDEQSLQQSLSTFSGHIRNIARALQEVEQGALVLLDEVGAGTDPGEGAALAKALLLAFQRAGAKTLASTHYGELKVLASNEPGFLNAAMEFDLKSLRPTFGLMVGMPGSSHALRIAERYGVPASIVAEAREGVGLEEQDVARMIEKLELAQKQAQRAQSEADRLSSELRKVQREAQAKLAEAEEAKRIARQNAARVLDEALREIRLEAEDVFEELRSSRGGPVSEGARARLKELQDVGRSLADDLRPSSTAPDVGPAPLRKGDAVRVEGLAQTGRLLADPSGKRVQVQIGAMKMTVDVRKLSRVSAAPEKAPRSRAGSMQLARSQAAKTEIHLRAMRAEDAVEALERFLDDAVLAGLDRVRIIHGKGEGILRQVTQDLLRKHRHVASFSEAEATEGGQGATVALLK